MQNAVNMKLQASIFDTNIAVNRTTLQPEISTNIYEQRGRCWHQSISPGTYPSRQRCFAATAARSAETKGTAQLVLRTQVRRKETHPHHPSTPLPPLRGSAGGDASIPTTRPHRSRPYGSQIRIRKDAHRKPTVPPMLGLGEERYKMHALRDWLPIEGA
jgi:hypothetical protein